MSKPIYKAQEKPYQDDINDLIEADEIAKGRGPDKEPRNRRGQGAKVDHDKGMREAKMNHKPDQVIYHREEKRKERQAEIKRMTPEQVKRTIAENDKKIGPKKESPTGG